MELVNNREKPDFKKVYEENYFKVFSHVLRKVTDRSDAEDLTSEIFVYCLSHYEDYDPTRSSIYTWLYIIAESRIKNYYRDKKQYVDISELEEILPSIDDDMEKSVYLTQLRNKVADVLEQLSERDRKVVVLKYFHNLSSEEIGAELGITAQNARVILTRALDKMEPLLEEFR